MSDAVNWIQPLFPEDEIPVILSAVIRSLENLKKTKPRELETSLNRRLRISLLRDHWLKDSPVEVDREKVLDDLTTGKESRLDISFTFSTLTLKPWPYFAIEAKRLRVSFKGKTYSQSSQYVDHHQGMMCFIDGRYSKGLRSAAMLGYVYDGDIAKARDDISGRIRKNHAKLKCKDSCGLRLSKISVQGIHETIHDLHGGDFTLFHILAAV